MRHWFPSVARTLTVIPSIALLVACTVSGGSAEPDPSPPAGAVYAEPSADLCDQVGFEEVMARWGLSVPSWDDPGSAYDADSTLWYVRCDFVGVADDGRFASVFGEFRVRGAVTLRVYRQAADAIEDFDQDAHSYFERPEGSNPVNVSGWWDAGVATTFNDHIVPIDAPSSEPGAAHLNSGLLVRHGNLVVLTYARAEAPLEEAEQATELLEDFVVAMLEEAVSHLSLSG